MPLLLLTTLLQPLSAWPAEEPTLARLTFVVAPERRADFERLYEQKLVPILQAQDFVSSTETGRATLDSAFCRLFEFDAPASIDPAFHALQEDASWSSAIAEVSAALGDSTIRHWLMIYRAPAGPGTVKPAGSGSRQGLWLSYDRKDGLSGFGPLAQDRDGSLWTPGLSRFDGEGVTSFTTSDGLPPSYSWATVCDGVGRMWFDFSSTVVSYDGRRFETFAAFEDGVGRRLGRDHVQDSARTGYRLAVDGNGDLWVGGDAGVARFDGDTFQRFRASDGLLSENVTALFAAADGALWIGYAAGGLSRYDGTGFEHYVDRDGQPTQAIQSMTQDRNGDLWVGGDPGLLARFDGRRFEDLTNAVESPRGGAGDVSVKDLAVDHEGDVWIGTTWGVLRYHGKRFERFTTDDGVAGNQTEDIHVDQDGFVWVATRSGGISRYDGVQFAHYSTEHGLASTYVFDAVKDQHGTLWFGNGTSVNRYDDGRFSSFTSAHGLAHDARVLLAGKSGRLWIGSAFDAGLTRYDGSEFVDFSEVSNLPDVAVYDMAEERDGTLWATTAEGLFRCQMDRCARVEVIETLLVRWPGPALSIDNGDNLWIGNSGSLVRYDGQTASILIDADTSDVGFINDIVEDRDGIVWILGSQQLLRYDGRSFRSYGPDEGLPDVMLYGQIFVDDTDVLWISAFGAGVVRFDGTVSQTLSRRDGLSDDGVHAVIQDEAGDFWITTDAGITRYHPLTRPPGVRVTGVVADQPYGPVAAVEMTTTQRFIDFSFRGRSLSTRSTDMAYVYRLEGHHEDWRVTREDHVQYSGLPSGDYHFEVKAVDRDLNYSEPAQVEVTVRPPYGSLALQAGLALALVGLVALGVSGARRKRERDRARDELLREQEKELQSARERDLAREELVKERRQRIGVQPHEIEQWTLDDFVGSSAAMQAVRARVRELQQDDSRALILGEAGTGKELVARAIHAGSPRSDSAFVPVRCAGLPREVESLEQRTQVLSILFGHAEGAVPGAAEERPGLLQQAHGGTLFFDEIGLLPVPLQTHLLGVLRDGEVRRIGAKASERLDLRVMAASSEDLEMQVEVGGLNRELYDYLAAHEVAVPPLRERREDIGPLTQQIVDTLSGELGLRPAPVGQEVLALLEDYDFPGNVRQLQSVLEQALRVSDGPVKPADLGLER